MCCSVSFQGRLLRLVPLLAKSAAIKLNKNFYHEVVRRSTNNPPCFVLFLFLRANKSFWCLDTTNYGKNHFVQGLSIESSSRTPILLEGR